MIISSRAAIAECLWLYGEPELAVRMIDTTIEEYRHVCVVAHSPTLLKGQGAKVSRSTAYGAVEALTGDARPPKRARSLPEGQRVALWLHVGRERPPEPSFMELMSELNGTDPKPRPPYTGPFVRSRIGLETSPNAILHHLRYLTDDEPALLVGRNNKDADDGEVYAQAYRLGRGRVLVEHRDGSASTHQHVVMPTNVKAAALLQSWWKDEDGWRTSVDWADGPGATPGA